MARTVSSVGRFGRVLLGAAGRYDVGIKTGSAPLAGVQGRSS